MGLLDTIKKQDFKDTDSVLMSSLNNPIKAGKLLKDWFVHNVEIASGQPQFDETSWTGYIQPLNDQSLESAINLAGLMQTGAIPFAPKSKGGTLGTLALPETEFSNAHLIAQKNAALPIEQGGLGLHPNNTAMERAQAMGFKTNAYHGTNYPGFEKFNTDGAEFTKTEGTGAFFTDNPKLANSYTDIDYPGSTPSVYPVLLKQEMPKKINFEGANWSNYKGKTTDELTRKIRNSKKYDSVLFKNVNDAGMGGYDIEGNILAQFKPSSIRSIFAAFDPKKNNSANILAGGLLGSLLLKDDNKNVKTDTNK